MQLVDETKLNETPDEKMEEAPVTQGPTTTSEDIVDIQLKSPKKKFRINGDNDMVIELNVGDLNIVTRLKEVYKKLNTLGQKAGARLADKEDATDESEIESIASALDELDKEMRDLVNYLFDSDVCSVCAKNMSMYSLCNGEFWFEHVIDVLSGLYESNLKNEYAKMNAKMKKHTDKYTGR